MYAVKFGQFELEHPIMNAAGTCKSLADVKELAKSAVSAIMVGSVTVEQRNGNLGNNPWVPLPEAGFSLNSLGLPNPGLSAYRNLIPEMKKIARDANKPLFVSVAGFSPDEYVTFARAMLDVGADFVELNLGCPNVWGDDGQKPIASFDLDLIRQIVSDVSDDVDRFGVKLSPYSNPDQLSATAKFLSGWKSCVQFVTTSNTYPNGYAVNAAGQPHVSVGVGLAGLGGQALKPIALGQLRQLKDQLDPSTHLIGVGGISSGQDVLDYVRTGATLVQVEVFFYLNGRNYSSILQSAEC